ncbi:MAG: hypothetical protein ACLFM2_10645, partial [Halothece sp.]
PPACTREQDAPTLSLMVFLWNDYNFLTSSEERPVTWQLAQFPFPYSLEKIDHKWFKSKELVGIITIVHDKP